ncbi:MAG: sigma-70 family RNA polymerase sigma factor [Deltaproteobacteria bacterium]|nr:sigma-70 family RNA polymerase sigma factor [Deltaproteobacteria bacterium]
MSPTKRAQRGDRDAFSLLYRRHYPELLRRAVRLLADEAAALDIVQEASLRAMAAIAKTDGRSLNFRAWMFRIVSNLCYRELAQRARTTSDDRLVALAADQSRVDAATIERQLAALVAEALDRLPAQYRQILLLREVEARSYRELADQLGKSEPMVKVTLHRARLRFSAAFLSLYLLRDRPTESDCAPLGELLCGGELRELERHLENCARCRGPQSTARRHVAEAFALLPISPELWGALSGAAASGSPAAATSSGAASGAPPTGASLGLSAAPWVGAALIAVLAVGLWIAKPTRKHSPTSPWLSSTPAIKVAARLDSASLATASLAPAAPAIAPPAIALPPATALPTGRLASRPAALRAPIDRFSVQPTTATVARRRNTRLAARPAKAPNPLLPAPLALRIYARTGALIVTRRDERFAYRTGQPLYLGDRLETRPSHQAVLRFAGHQWLVLRGKLRLLSVPLKGEAPAQLELALSAGEMRGQATAHGAGLVVVARDERIDLEQARFRLRLSATGDVRVEVVSGRATVRGDHAQRTIVAGSGCTLGGRVGFARALLAAPTQLRPVRCQGRLAPPLSWQPVAGARRYLVRVGRDADFLQITERRLVERPGFRPKSSAAGRYFWQVIAIDTDGWGLPSKVYSFYTLRGAGEIRPDR